MQLSDVSIQRPVFATVLSLLLLVGGFAALSGLPVREYPAIDPPIVSVNTVYRGASNEVIENRITEIVEGAIAGIEGIKQISSQSQNGRSSVNIEFGLGRDPDAAAPTCATAWAVSSPACPQACRRPSCSASTPTPSR